MPATTPRSGVIASIAADHNQAAAHPLAEHGAGIALDDEAPSPHPESLTNDRAARALIGIACDLKLSARHGRPSTDTGAAAQNDPAATHATADIGASITIDHDLALAQGPTDAVATVIGAGDTDRGRIAALDPEDIPYRDCGACRRDIERFDLALAEVSQTVRRQRRKIEPLLRPLLKLED